MSEEPIEIGSGAQTITGEGSDGIVYYKRIGNIVYISGTVKIKPPNTFEGAFFQIREAIKGWMKPLKWRRS